MLKNDIILVSDMAADMALVQLLASAPLRILPLPLPYHRLCHMGIQARSRQAHNKSQRGTRAETTCSGRQEDTNKQGVLGSHLTRTLGLAEEQAFTMNPHTNTAARADFSVELLMDCSARSGEKVECKDTRKNDRLQPVSAAV